MQAKISHCGDKGVLTITPPPYDPAKKGHYIIVLDKSGSMNRSAELTVTNDSEKHGWSYLDIAKHAATTAFMSLSEQDIATFITYSDTATSVFQNLACTAGNKNATTDMVYNVRCGGGTNFSEALAMIESVVSHAQCADHVQIMFFTDGYPSYYDSTTFCAFKDNIRKVFNNTCFTTFAVGNDVDSKLLSQMGHAFLHISDPSMVGEILCSNLATMKLFARWCDISITTSNNSNNVMLGDFSSMLRHGQDKTFSFIFHDDRGVAPVVLVDGESVVNIERVTTEEWERK